MVLTNFECWAHGEPSSAAAAGFETGSLRHHLDPFNPRAVGFISDANNNNSGDNNSSATDGQPTPEVLPLEVLRCKKRLNPHGDCGGDMDQPVYTKRCRYDDADLAAQYCNDFFSLPATQIIGTQACLMDYEMQANGGGMMMESEPSFPHQQQQHLQQQQHQQQQQQQPQRIYQHYQESAERATSPPSKIKRRRNDPLEKIQLNIECSSSEAAADMYIATHGGCLHHFSTLSGGGSEESDI
ncbi:probable serine/threonine-protein kinase DDB_G0271682 [Drosophila serrata]|uniref:probable serine/threonine-protein kinase DDB_G0271682 n=1 Tax=Drosophila serrata TaxID=7274 RepID=UPI000A1D18EE|nr:probable serine/threonine-protein kinase DDB_G0271682 [Drosophila serrata]